MKQLHDKTKMKINPRVYVTPDEGFSWAALLGAFICMAICSLYTVVGVYNIVFLEVFQHTQTETAWLIGTHGALASLMGPISGVLINLYNVRVSLAIGGFLAFIGFFANYFITSFFFLFIFYGFIAGVGIGICLTTGVTIPCLYFKEYKELASGIASAGLASGTALFSPFIIKTSALYGWQGSMLIVAGITLHMFLAASLCWPIKPEETHVQCYHDAEKPSTSKQADINNYPAKFKKSVIFDSDVFKIPLFVAFCFALFFANISLAIFATYLPILSMQNDTNYLDASNIMAWSGVAGMFGRILTGFISNFTRIHDTLHLCILSIISALLLFLSPWTCKWYLGQIFTSILFGMFGSGIYVLLPLISLNLVGLPSLSTAIGMGAFMCGVGFIFGPILGGIVYDLTLDYKNTFILGGSSYGVCAIIMAVMFYSMKRKRNYEKIIF